MGILVERRGDGWCLGTAVGRDWKLVAGGLDVVQSVCHYVTMTHVMSRKRREYMAYEGVGFVSRSPSQFLHSPLVVFRLGGA